MLLLASFEGADNEITDNSRGTESESLNPGIAGKFYFQDKKPVLMDIETGNYTFFSHINWKKRYPRNLAYHYALPTRDGENMIVTVKKCELLPGYINEYYTCIAIQDFEGNYLHDFKIKYDIQSLAELSPDGKYVALIRELDRDVLEIYNLSGERLSAFAIPEGFEVNSFEWLANGRLVYSVGHEIVFTKPYSTKHDYIFTLPKSKGQGQITGLEVSPDDKKVSFVLQNGGNALVTKYATFWCLDIATNQVRELATIPKEDTRKAGFKYATWSPDGKWIAVYEGGWRGSSSFNPGGLGYLYVLPANHNQTLTVSPYKDERSPEVKLIKRYHVYTYGESRQDKRVREQFMNKRVYWLPD